MGPDISLLDTLYISLGSILIVFLVLILIMGIVMLFKFIPEIESLSKKYGRKRKRKYVVFENMDEDMQVAVLVATVFSKKELNTDVVLKSVKRV